jgi:hypothetical protein
MLSDFNEVNFFHETNIVKNEECANLRDFYSIQYTGNIYPKTQHLFDGFYPPIFILLYNGNTNVSYEVIREI